MAKVQFMSTWVRVWVTALLSSLWVLTAASPSVAHEVEPTVANIEIGDQVSIILDWVIEAPVAGIDLEGLEDTNASERADEYDRLRALPPAELEADFRNAWPQIRDQITLRAGDTPLTPELQSVSVGDVGNVEVPRISEVRLTAPLPDGADAVVFGFDAALGPLVVRQQGVENPYSAFLTAGTLSDPIERGGAAEAQTAWAAFVEYIGVGFDHIVPLGLDHILFVLGVFFLSLRLGALLWQITAFTLAHTVTLALGALDIVRVSPDIVEPLIAASIVYVGVENIFARGLTPWRPAVVFLFGLLHGLGFASVLSDFGLGADHFVPKLIGFNVGVEFGQLSVILVAWLVLGAIYSRYDWYRRRIAKPVSAAIAVIALYWVFERTGVIGGEGIFAPIAGLTDGGWSPWWTAIITTAIVMAMTVWEVATISDRVRDIAGILTSFVLFVAIIATFTAGAWWWCVGLAVVWVLALRIQTLGGPEDMPA